jgi:hypothetical protein
MSEPLYYPTSYSHSPHPTLRLCSFLFLDSSLYLTAVQCTLQSVSLLRVVIVFDSGLSNMHFQLQRLSA